MDRAPNCKLFVNIPEMLHVQMQQTPLFQLLVKGVLPMNEKRKSFIMYGDSEEILSMLPEAGVGRVMMAVFAYFNTGAEPVFTEPSEKMAFTVIRQSLDRNTDKYEQSLRVDGSRLNRGGAPVGNKNACRKSTETTVNDLQNNSNNLQNNLNNQNNLQNNLNNQNNLQNNSNNQTTETTKTTSVNDNISVNVNDSANGKERSAEPQGSAERSPTENNAPAHELHLGRHRNIRITDAEYRQLFEKYSIYEVNGCIAKLSEHIHKTRKTYPDYAKVIAFWIEKAREGSSQPGEDTG